MRTAPNEGAASGALIDRVSAAAPVIVIAYLVAQFAARLLAPGGLGLDEAEQMLATQTLAWGYGAQPPLYTWLQMGVFEVTGPGKLGLALLKLFCISAIYLGIWALARGLGADKRMAAVAMLGVMLLPSIVWEAQRALTHSVLSTALAVWTLVAASWAARTGRLAAFLAMGALVGLGILAKWSYAIVALGLLGAIVALPSLRKWESLAALAVAALVVARPGLWALENFALATSSVHKLGLSDGVSGPSAMTAMTSFGEALASSGALAVITLTAIFATRRTWHATASFKPGLVTYVVLFGIASILAATLISGATAIKERWLQPLMVFVPLLLAQLLATRVPDTRLWAFYAILAAVALAILVAYPTNLRNGARNPSYQSAPLAEVLAEAALPDTTVAAQDAFLGGNTMYHHPGIGAVTPSLPALLPEETPTHAIWWTRSDTPREMPPELRALIDARAPGTTLNAPRHITRPYPAPHGDRHFTLSVAEVQP